MLAMLAQAGGRRPRDADAQTLVMVPVAAVGAAGAGVGTHVDQPAAARAAGVDGYLQGGAQRRAQRAALRAGVGLVDRAQESLERRAAIVTFEVVDAHCDFSSIRACPAAATDAGQLRRILAIDDRDFLDRPFRKELDTGLGHADDLLDAHALALAVAFLRFERESHAFL